MVTIFSLLNDIYKDLSNTPRNKINPKLVKYFKTEYRSSWKLELNRYLIKKEGRNDKKAA